MAKVKMNLRRKSLDQKLDLAANIVTNLTGNADFPNPNPPLPDLTTKRTDILAKKSELHDAQTTLDRLESELETLERELDSLLSSEGAYIQSASGGDETRILSAGVEVADVPTPAGPVAAPGNLRATGGDLDGEADLAWDPVQGRDTYIAECASTATGPWTQIYVGKKSSFTATSLTSGQLYYFRVRAVGTKGPGPWSDIAHKRAT